ncbi:hypothetical protein ID866_6781 [Astraeus odoratus]|nr:hypothetical protein ID866_6781 [Astraeus odoratus]
MTTSTIPFDTSLGPELVEFWTKKYKETKEELESLRENVSRDHLSVNCEILDIVRSIKNLVETREDVALRRELEAVTKERDELAVRFAHLEAERNALFTFSHSSLSSAAMSAFQQRRAAVDLRFPPVAFLAPTHQLSAMPFADYKKILQYLPTVRAFARPSHAADIQSAAIFHRAWSYLGKYISAPLADFEMKLAEWMSLNEEVRGVRPLSVA